MLPQGGAVEAPKYQVMIRVVNGLPDKHVYKEMVVCPRDLFHPGTHLPHQLEYSPHSPAAVTGVSVQKKALQHIL